MSILSPHQAHTWPKSPPEYQKRTITLNLNNSGQNGQILKVFVPIIKPARSAFRGKKTFFDFDLFCLRSGPKREPTPQITSEIWHFCLKKWYAYLWRFITLARRVEMQDFFWPSSSQRNGDFSGGATFMFATFFDCTAGKTAGLPSIFWYFSADSGSYLRPGRSKWHTLKGQNHLLDVANAGKPWGRVQLHQGGQECIRKDH